MEDHRAEPDNSLKHNLVLPTSTPCAELSQFPDRSAELVLEGNGRVTPQYGGTIQDFQIRYGLDQRVFHFTGRPDLAGRQWSRLCQPENHTVFDFLRPGKAGHVYGQLGQRRHLGSRRPAVCQRHGHSRQLDRQRRNVIITLDGNRTISGLTFNNTLGGSYRIAKAQADRSRWASSASVRASRRHRRQSYDCLSGCPQ